MIWYQRDKILKTGEFESGTCRGAKARLEGSMEDSYTQYTNKARNTNTERIGGEGMSLNVYSAHSGAIYQADPRSFTS